MSLTQQQTFVKRKTGLFKKAHEFGVLTGTQIAVIIFSQQDKLFTYASDPVAQICARFLENPQAMEAKMPADVRSQKVPGCFYGC